MYWTHAFVVAFSLLVWGKFVAPATAASRPNIVVLVADDLGWADVGYHGSRIPTPNIDRLVRGGVELDQHYVAPMCTPTRAALLTGRYWSRFGNTAPSNTQVLPFGTPTLASVFADAGYDTGITGKWHLGSLPKWGPRKFGFASTHGSLAGGVGPWNHRYKKGDYSETWHRNDRLIEQEGHVTDLIAEEAIRFIRVKRNSPFLLYVPFTAVHHPLQEPPQWLAKGEAADPSRPQYAACTMHMDDAVGDIVKAIEASGQASNTLVLFFSDNGGTIAAADADNARYPGVYPRSQALGRNEPLRGRKTQLYEGGIRTPAFVYWPSKLRPGRVAAPLHVVDWMPTLCRLVGLRPKTSPRCDGIDIWPQLTGEKTSPDARVLYWLGVRARSAAIRKGEWKLIVHGADLAGRRELFHLGRDPNEESNLAKTEEERVVALEKLLRDQYAKDNDALP